MSKMKWVNMHTDMEHITVNNWKCKFPNPQEEVGKPTEKFNEKVDLHWLEKSCW